MLVSGQLMFINPRTATEMDGTLHTDFRKSETSSTRSTTEIQKKKTLAAKLTDLWPLKCQN